MGKEPYGDLKEGLITGPLIFSSLDQELRGLLRDKRGLQGQQLQRVA